jgi:hypothetical protein
VLVRIRHIRETQVILETPKSFLLPSFTTDNDNPYYFGHRARKIATVSCVEHENLVQPTLVGLEHHGGGSEMMMTQRTSRQMGYYALLHVGYCLSRYRQHHLRRRCYGGRTNERSLHVACYLHTLAYVR